MSAQFQFRVKGIDQATAELKATVGAGMRSGLEKVGLRGEQLVHENVITPFGQKPPAVATGNLAGAVFVDFQGGRNLLKAVIAAGPPADVYVAPVETGARPHFPPPGALLLWVKQKFNPSDEKEALSIAFAVAHKIAQRGTKGHFMFERAFEQLQKEAQGIFEREIAEAIDQAGSAPPAKGD